MYLCTLKFQLWQHRGKCRTFHSLEMYCIYCDEFSKRIQSQPNQIILQDCFFQVVKSSSFNVTSKVRPNSISSILFVGFFIFRLWKATLVSSLFVRKVVLPFDGIEELVLFSDSKIFVVPDSALMDRFKFSKDPIWQRAWSERIEPNMDFYDAYLKSEKLTII